MAKKTNVLDDLLPLLKPQRAEVHENAAILEVSDMTQLVELAANPKIRRFLLGRLSDTVALIDPDCSIAIEKALKAEGHTPKTVRGSAR